jgi:hypothetical protein
VRVCRAVLEDFANFARHYAMDLAGGWAVADGLGDALLEACRVSGELGVEAVVTPEGTGPGSRGVVMTFAGKEGPPNFEISQDGAMLLFRLAAGAAGGESLGPVELCPLEAGRPHHAILSCSARRWDFYLDGRPRAGGMGIGDLAGWTPGRLVFGDAPGGGADWAGRLEGIHVHSRSIGPREADERAAEWKERLAGRKVPPCFAVRARLLKATPIPGPESGLIHADYPRIMVPFEYEVVEVVAGEDAPGKIVVLHWAVLDLKPVRRTAALEEGRTYRLVLERYEDNEWLESERYVDVEDEEALELPLFYDVER